MTSSRYTLSTFIALTLACSLSACGHEGHSHSENELITRVTLTFSSTAEAPQAFVFDDPDGDGGDAPVADAIALASGEYDLNITFENALADPPEDITKEVLDEADEHQVFLTGSAVNGPASDVSAAPLAQSYADQDENGFPIGLSHSVVASAGSGELVVTLRHLPAVGGTATKDESLATTVKDQGFAAIPGSSDANVRFQLEVQ